MNTITPNAPTFESRAGFKLNLATEKQLSRSLIGMEPREYGPAVDTFIQETKEKPELDPADENALRLAFDTTRVFAYFSKISDAAKAPIHALDRKIMDYAANKNIQLQRPQDVNIR